MNAPEPVLPVSGPTVGRRLAAAREQRGLDQAAAARLSGLSAEVVRGLEAEDWAALGAPVYVRGWLARYCRVLDVEASRPRVLDVGPGGGGLVVLTDISGAR